MKALSLLSALFLLFWTSSTEPRPLRLGSCVITTDLQDIQNVFSKIRDSVQARDEDIDTRILRNTESLRDTKPSDRCCLLHHVLRLYLDRVFNNFQTSDHHTLRMISNLANSFLTIEKDLGICHDHMMCHCGREATEKHSEILNHFKELEPQAAAVKALGEVDILLRWMEETKEEMDNVAENSSGQEFPVLSTMET